MFEYWATFNFLHDNNNDDDNNKNEATAIIDSLTSETQMLKITIVCVSLKSFIQCLYRHESEL
jgi:hypothetical protein